MIMKAFQFASRLIPLSLAAAILLLPGGLARAEDEKKPAEKKPEEPKKEEVSIFPDKNLEAVVRYYVFEKRNTDKPVTEQDVANISTIAGKDKGIADLTGLE